MESKATYAFHQLTWALISELGLIALFWCKCFQYMHARCTAWFKETGIILERVLENSFLENKGFY